MRVSKILLLAAMLLTCARANAAERMKVGFLGDLVTGVSIPIGDNDYQRFADPSFKIGLRLGVVLELSRSFSIAPEAEFDFVAVEPDRTDFPSVSGTIGASTSIFDERGLFGARYIFPFALGAFYLRTLIGVDHLGGTSTVNIGGLSGSSSFDSTAFALEPGAGIEFNIVRHLVIGFSTGFPIAFHHLSQNRSFTAANIDLLATVGLRL